MGHAQPRSSHGQMLRKDRWLLLGLDCWLCNHSGEGALGPCPLFLVGAVLWGAAACQVPPLAFLISSLLPALYPPYQRLYSSIQQSCGMHFPMEGSLQSGEEGGQSGLGHLLSAPRVSMPPPTPPQTLLLEPSRHCLSHSCFLEKKIHPPSLTCQYVQACVLSAGGVGLLRCGWALPLGVYASRDTVIISEPAVWQVLYPLSHI